MRSNKKLLLSLLIVFCVSLSLTVSYSFSTNIQEDEIVVKSVTPVTDDESNVVITEDNGVIFNDKNQRVKYNVVIENISNYELKMNEMSLSTPTEEFLKYEVEGINNGDVLKSKETKELVVSLETVQMEGWGRNFNEELATNITFDKIKSTNLIQNVVNPNTGDKKVVLLLSFLTCTIGLSIIVIFSKNKVARYMILVITLSSTLTITNAQDSIVLPIKINVSFESQNVMSKSGKDGFKCGASYACYIEDDWFYFWKYSGAIKNIYIENAKREIKGYAYEYDVSEEQNGRVKAYLVENANDSDYYDLYLIADGMIYMNSDTSYYFAFFDRLETINNLEGLDTSNVTNMESMFNYTGYYSTNFTLDLSSFDTSNVTNTEYMFAYTGYKSTNFTLDLSSFDTSNVTNMSYMFYNTGYNNPTFTLDVSNFDTSNVTDMGGMFYGTGYSSSIFTLDVSNFDTSNVTSMSHMFDCTGANNPNLTLDLSSFDTSNVTDMSAMFMNAGKNSTNLTLDLSSFDTSNVTNMVSMFAYTGYNSTNLTLDVSNFDTSNVTEMSMMFDHTGYNNPNFTLDLSNFDTSNVTTMKYMFDGTGYNSTNLTLDLSNFDTSNVTNMSFMFSNTGYNSENFTLDVSNFDTSNVTNMQYMFNGTGYNSTKFITSITIKNPKTTSYSAMFRNVATKNSSQITVNYTSETRDIVDKMISTKSSNSNVVKGTLVE